MPYGDASDETAMILRQVGYESALWITEDSPAAYRVDIVCYGALDESFDINDSWDPTDIAHYIYAHLLGRVEDFSVEVYSAHGYPPDLIVSMSKESE